MSQLVIPWTPANFSENADVFRARPVLRRPKQDWNNPVSFLYKESTAVASNPRNESVIPVMPNIAVGGKLELLPMRSEDFNIDVVNGSINPSAKAEVEQEIRKAAEDDAPWNQAYLDSNNTKSLYRVYFTHDYLSNEYVTPRGLYNTRNMCFFNSVLQVLVHCAPFNALLKDIMLHVPLSNVDKQSPVLNGLIRFAHDYASKDSRRAISGERFYDIICSQPHFHVERDRQEDSQEFLSDLFDVLENNFRKALPTPEDEGDALINARRRQMEEAKNEDNGWKEVGHKNKAVETQHAGHQDLDNPIQELFGGRFKSVLVKQGGKPSVTTEPFQQIPVDISGPDVNSVQHAFAEVLAEEHLTLGTTPATKHLELDLLPPLLIVHLKRFTFIRHGDNFEFGKITKPITIEDTLKLSCNGEGLVEYAPIGVVYHHGLSATRGHYTADVKVKGQWYSIDDEQVVPVQGSEVLGRDVSGGSRSAYMVFYEKKKSI